MARARPRRRSPDAHAALKAGLMLTVSAALFAGMYFQWGRLGRTWRGVLEYKVLFAQVKTLKPDAPIRYDGMELGRVRDVRLVRANPDTLRNVKPFTAADLLNLPLSPAERSQLSLLGPALDAAAREKIRGRHMVAVTLEILMDDDEKRLRSDDAYFVSSDKLGYSAVEIKTGKEQPVRMNAGSVLLGINADVMSDIGKNMEEITEILRNVAGIFGGPVRAKALVSTQLGAFQEFAANLDTQTESIAGRVPKIWDRIDSEVVSWEHDSEDVMKQILALRPRIDDALKSTDKSIGDIRKEMGASSADFETAFAAFRKQTQEELAGLRKSSGDYREAIPNHTHEYAAMAANALETSGRVDAMLDRFELEMRERVANGRVAVNAGSAAAMNLQETLWQFRQDPGYFTARLSRNQASARHQNWRKDMARQQYVELRRELAAIQSQMGAADPADQERLRHVEQLLSESDAFFGVDRGAYLPGAGPGVPGTEIKSGTPIPLPGETIEVPDPDKVPRKKSSPPAEGQ